MTSFDDKLIKLDTVRPRFYHRFRQRRNSDKIRFSDKIDGTRITTIAFKSNRCDRDLCYEMTYFPCCLKVSKYIAIPFYTSLSFRNWWDLSKEVLYDLVGWKVTELPAFKVCPVTTNARFTMYIESKHDFRANVQLWTLVTLKSFKLQGHTVPFWKDLINS